MSSTTAAFWRLAVTAVIVSHVACAPSAADLDGPAVAEAKRQLQTIDHLLPKRDSTGGIPARFEWTPINGADNYSLAVWNEIDVVLFEQTNLPRASAQWPKGYKVEAGTYFWGVVAFRDGKPIGESGRAAFVVTD